MIYITGEIDEAKFEAFNQAMDDSEHSKAKIIEIVLVSSGGDEYSALAFYDRIKQSSKEIRITVYGVCMSAAVIILAAGDIRRMAQNAWVMVHEGAPLPDDTLRVSHIESVAKHARRVEDQWDRLLEESTGTPASTWKILHSKETYLMAEECKELGLIEEIL